MKLTLLCAVTLLGTAFALPQLDNLDEWREDHNIPNRDETSGQFEGDIILSLGQQMAMKARAALIDSSYRWPNNVIPYTITPRVFSTVQVLYIRLALQQIERKTCIRFVERTTEEDYVYITGEETGCWSHVGRAGGPQQLNLEPSAPGSGCFEAGTIQHEFLHVLGFFHMQSAVDRDNYVSIQWDNIMMGKEHDFTKYSSSISTNFGLPYDYSSIMHSGPYTDSKNGKPTIVAKRPFARIGQRSSLSILDIEKINIMYNCKAMATPYVQTN